MKVLILSSDFPPLYGGIARFAHNLAQGLQQLEVSVRVVTSVPSPARNSEGGVPAVRTPAWLNKKFLKLVPMVCMALWCCLRDRPDRIVAMVWTHDGLVAYAVRRVLRVPYVLVVHGSEISRHQRSKMRRRVMMKIFKNAETVVANSIFTKSLVLGLGLAPERVEVLNPPVSVASTAEIIDTSEVDRRYHLRGKRVLLTTARLFRHKGHAEVIRVLGQLTDKYPELVYVITGEGPYRPELQKLAQACGVENRVKMIGFVSQDTLDQLYQRSEIYISPSQEDKGHVEGFGLSFVEASAHGRPVIAGRSGGVADAVVDQETGFLVEPCNLEEIKRALVRLLENSDLRERLGRTGRVRALTEFGVNKQATKLREILERQVQNRNTGR